MRMRSASAKVATVIVSYLFIVLIGVAVAILSESTTWSAVTVVLLTLLMVLACTRLFRGPDENADPRPWWRLTGGPTSGFIVGAAFAVGSGVNLFAARGPALVASAVYVLIGLLFVASAVKLSAVRRGEIRRSEGSRSGGSRSGV